MSNKITVYTMAWGNYWERFGAIWSNNILNLNTAPDEIVIVSDRPIKTDFKVIINDSKLAWSCRNSAVDSATGDWIVPLDIDDEPFPNFIDNLDNTVDIHAFSLVTSDGTIWNCSQKKWDKISLIGTQNPIPSCSAVKSALIKKIKYRSIGWEDWGLWIDLKNHGASAKFDHTIRYKHNNFEDSYGKVDKINRRNEIDNIKRIYI